MANCKGCGRQGLKRSGVTQHCKQSRNPRCRKYLAQLKSAKQVGIRTMTAGRPEDGMPSSHTTAGTAGIQGS